MMTSFTGYWLTRGLGEAGHCLARRPSSSFNGWLVEQWAG